jgi:hypothetical protein
MPAPPRVRGGPTPSILRNAEVRRLLEDRYGERLPDDDAGRSDLAVQLAVLAPLGHGEPHLRVHLANVAPWLRGLELEDMIDRAYSRDWRFTADNLAERLGVCDAERTRLKLWTIGAVDFPKQDREARRKARKVARQRERRREQRRAAGRKPRAVYLAEALTRTRPWDTLGISRRTWERQRKRGRGASSEGQQSTSLTVDPPYQRHAPALAPAGPYGRSTLTPLK